MKNKKRDKKNMKKQLCLFTLSSVMILGACTSAYAAPLSKLPEVLDNSLVIGQHLFELDKVNSSQYNLNTFVEASKTTEGQNNGVYYKYNGKWYTGKDIESFVNLKKGKGLDTIPNDITKVNGEVPKINATNGLLLDWYVDGDYEHDKDGENECPEQFEVYFNKAVKANKGKVKMIIPDKTKQDPYGEGKFGTIEFSLDGKTPGKPLEKVEGGVPADIFVVSGEYDNVQEKQGCTKRFTFKLTEDWTRILNTEKTGLKYYDDRFKGIRLMIEGLEDVEGNEISEVTAKNDLELVKDETPPKVILHRPIYTKIGERGFQPAGSTSVVFNEPVQIFTDEIKNEIGNKSGIYNGYKVITPSQYEIKNGGIPVTEFEFFKVDDSGNALLKDGEETLVKGRYALEGDIESDDIINSDEYDNRITLMLKDVNFESKFDKENIKLSRHRDFGMYFIDPVMSLPEGKWKLRIKNVANKVGNVMTKYESEIINIKPYFTIKELNKNGMKVSFTEPFKKADMGGVDYVPVMIVNGNKEEITRFYIDDIKDGDTDAEVKFEEPVEELKGTVYVNNMIYEVKEQNDNTNKEDSTDKKENSSKEKENDAKNIQEKSKLIGTSKVEEKKEANSQKD